MLVEKSGKPRLVLPVGSTDNSSIFTYLNADAKVFETNKNNVIALAGKEISPIVPPLQSQGFVDSTEEPQRPLLTPVPELSTKEMIDTHQQSPPVGQISRASASVGEKEISRIQSRVSSDFHSSAVYSLSWSSVENKIASGSWDKTIKIWDGKSLELLKTLKGHSSHVTAVSWNHDGTQIVSGSDDNTIKIWDSFTGKELHTLRGHSQYVLSVAWNKDSSKINIRIRG
jgi:WD40 repeat protein